MGKIIKYSLFVVILIVVILVINAIRKACTDEGVELNLLKKIYDWTRKGIQAVKAKKEEAKKPVTEEEVAGE